MFYRDLVMNIDGVEIHIGKRIDFLRNMLGITQEELAKKLGVTQTAVCSWEVGRAKPEADKIDGIAKALTVTREQFVGTEAINWRLFG